MPIPVEKLTEELLALPAAARALLADRLVESLDPLSEEHFRAQWIEEARRRLNEVRAGTVKTIPEEIARKRARDRLQK